MLHVAPQELYTLFVETGFSPWYSLVRLGWVANESEGSVCLPRSKVTWACDAIADSFFFLMWTLGIHALSLLTGCAVFL